ncbi:Protein HASTY 1 [Acorus calamus]|uniref:Protein HASTY 1 n=1 Tax=Acorus calamus TaxID=4465 RepID=A0AAV9CU02_ACOCL|nr:Protein HASTY 1 [Acorus calamus]
MDEGGIAENVARAIAAAFDWSSPPDSRKAAVAYLDSIKSGDVRTLASTSLCLVRRDWSSEIRLHGFKMLQHLVRLRWDEFSTTERINFANLVIVELIPEMANPSEEWALKSQAAALAAEVVRREGVNLWQELLPSLGALCHKGPVEAELVAMILRWLPEDVTVHNEDLEGDRRRSLLRGLTESLPEILPLLYNLLEKHFGAAMSEASNQQLDLAKQHATTITAVLNAVNAYAEWAPVIDLAKYGLIHGCGFLLNSVEFRFHSCEFFKIVSQRKRVNDTSVAEYDSAMRNVFQILMNISRDFLCKSISGAAGIDEIEFELAECVCESMVALGSLNMQCIASDSSLISQYLQQMLGYFQHFKLALHFQALLFWLVLMRDGISKPKVSVQTIGSGPVEKERKGMSMHVSDDICAAMLDVSFQRMLRKNIPSGTTMPVTELELWSDEFVNKCDFSQYRSRLLDLIRLVASHRPVVAAARVSQRIETIIKSCHDTSPQALTLLESMQLGLETVLSAVFDGSADLRDDVMVPIQRLLEGLLQQLLSLGWTEPALAEILGHYLDALGPFLRSFPNGLGGVIDKLFQLLTSLPLTIQDQSPTGARHARFQICTSFIRIAKAAERSLLPHMKGIAETMARLQGEGRLLRGEHNLLGEAFLVMASSAGIQQQQEVLAWLLEPLSKQWTQLDWQNAYLSDPMGLTRLCSDTQFMWSIFHTVTFFEKALKRSGIKKTNIYLQPFSVAGDSSQCLHPMSPHLPWMLPPLLKLLHSIHSLWSQPVSQSLPPHLRAAMNMGHVEMASFLGEGAKMPKGQLSFADGSLIDMNREGYAEPNENDIRNWLKGIRESGYNVLGLSTTIGDCFFQCLDSSSVTLALMENIQSMGFRHIRQLVHLTIIPLVKSCPAQLWRNGLKSSYTLCFSTVSRLLVFHGQVFYMRVRQEFQIFSVIFLEWN